MAKCNQLTSVPFKGLMPSVTAQTMLPVIHATNYQRMLAYSLAV